MSKKNKSNEEYHFERILRHRFKKGKYEIVRSNPLFEIKWKKREATTEILKTYFVEHHALVEYKRANYHFLQNPRISASHCKQSQMRTV